jgi:Cu(I)/Ag(I) efflux system membrane fusion protein
MRADGYAQVLEGLAAGDAVVVSANFLIDAESNLKAAMASFGETAGSHPAAGQIDSSSARSPGSESHRGTGYIEAVDWTQKTVTIAHGPIASLGWPAMNMSFGIIDSSLLNSLKPGQQVDFEFIEKQAGGHFITRIGPAQRKEAAGPALSDQRRH